MSQSTDAAALEQAREMFAGEWDAEGTVGAFLPKAVAVTFLESQGWVKEERKNRLNGVVYTSWYAPFGNARAYGLEEATQLAIAAAAYAGSSS